MTKTNTKVWRGIFYFFGVALVCIGVSMSSRLNLGVATVCTLPYSVSEKTGLSFSNMLLAMYLLMVLAQFIMKGKHSEKKDLLQIPISFVFSAIMGWLENGIFANLDAYSFTVRLVLYFLAVTIFSIGSALMVPMKLIPNPADGFTDAIGFVTKKDLGFARNVMDALCVVLGLIGDLILHHKIISIGIGTIISMVIAGRVIAVYNHFFLEKMLRLSGMTEANT